jgi:hypothetical protein
LEAEPDECDKLPSILTELEAMGLVFVEGERFIGLSLDLNSDYNAGPRVMRRLQDLLVELGGGATADKVLIDNIDSCVDLIH